MPRRFRPIFQWTAFRVSAALSLVLVLLYLLEPPILQLFELKAYDFRLRWRGEIPTTGQVVIVAIDERSLQELGQWPWPRVVMAHLIEKLSKAGARVIGLDVIWAEPEQRLGVLDALYADTVSVGQLPLLGELRGRLNQLAKKNPDMDRFLRDVTKAMHPDEVLARAIRESQKVVLGDFFFTNPEEVPEALAAAPREDSPILAQSAYPVVRKGRSVVGAPFVPRPYLIKGNIPVIERSARAFGYFNMIPDTDGVVRSVPLVMEYRGHYLLPLSLQTLRFSGDPSQWIIHLEEYGVAGIQWEGGWIPTTELGFMHINYRGKDRTFPYVSASDVVRDRFNPEEIRGKIVLVGAVATGIYDLRVTPLASVFPGVEVHANVIDNVIKGDFILRPEWASLMDMLLLVCLGLGFGWLFARLPPIAGGAFMLGVFGANLYVNTLVLVRWGAWLNVIYPSLMIPMSYLGVSIFKYIHEEREKRKIKGAFQAYVTPAVVHQILKDPNALKLGGEQRVLTVLFSDIRGFTTISESLTPEGLVHLLNEYLTEMSEVIFRHEGTVDKYIGDAIMAIYGAPLPQEDHPIRACLTALDMMHELAKLQMSWEERGMPRIDIGIGVNTGEMVVGNMGSQRRFDYTVMGDAVNLASRLEGLNKQYGTHIIISEFTHERVEDLLVCRELDCVRVKGKAKPVTLYEVLGRKGDGSPAGTWIEVFSQGLRYYRELQWERAMESFQRVLALKGQDTPSTIYLERCRTLQASPPEPGWDGVFEWKTK